jgi:AcrR family transcriptional regulator
VETFRTGRRLNPRGQGARLRAELIAAAFSALDAEGVADRLTLRGVARTAGVTAPAVYRAFAHLSALVAALRAAVLTELRTRCQAAAGSAGDPRDRLIARSTAYVTYGLAYPARVALVFSHVPSTEPLADALLTDLVEAIGECVSSGESSSSNPRVDSVHLIAALHGIVVTRHAAPGFPWPPLDRSVSEVVTRLAGLQPS